MDLTFGVTLTFRKKKSPLMLGKVFYKDGSHVIEIHSVEDATKFIKGLIPPYPEEMMTKTVHEDVKEHGIG